MRKIIGLVSLILLAPLSHAQKFTFSGYIKDAETGESLIGATLIHPKTSSGSSANTHGFYSLTLPKILSHFSIAMLAINQQQYGFF